jgi:predicted RNA binding protein YcfA (HicA-like mRNA interferase family)
MSKHEKTVEKIYKVPTPTDLRWDEVVSCLTALGFTEKQGNGSRRKFIHLEAKLVGILHEPHPKPTLKQYAVRDVKDLLDKYREWESTQ